MVLRYAGARGIYARDFRSLVRENEGGIFTSELTQAVRAAGWEVLAGDSDVAGLHRELSLGRPVVVLLAEGPASSLPGAPIGYHYVVVVGWSRGGVRIHDPARGAGVSLSEERFAQRWDAAGRWALSVVGQARGSSAPAERPEEIAFSQARSLASTADEPRSVEVTTAAAADSLLARASDSFRASRWVEAAALARAATRSGLADERAWSLFATSSYLAGDTRPALWAWNRVGEPRLDLVRVTGLERTRQPVVHRLMGLRPGEVLIGSDLERARRRLELLPSARSSSLTYRVLPGGLAEVEASVLEPTLLPNDRLAAAALLARAVVESELEVGIASPSGGGEAATLALGWSRAQSLARTELAAPAFLGAPGIARLEAGWTSERHRIASDEEIVREARTHASLVLTDWASGWLAWEVGGGVERFERAELSPTLRLGARAADPSGRVDLIARADRSLGGGSLGYQSGSLLAHVRALPTRSRWSLGARALLAGVDTDAPRLAWPGAGVGRVREGLLRAHPLTRDGALEGETLAPRMINGSIELERSLVDVGLGRLAVAGFADAARFAGAPSTADAGTFLDGGVGVRLHVPGGRLSLDAAAGHDGRRALSLVWQKIPR
jgi:hypothetical protein